MGMEPPSVSRVAGDDHSVDLGGWLAKPSVDPVFPTAAGAAADSGPRNLAFRAPRRNPQTAPGAAPWKPFPALSLTGRTGDRVAAMKIASNVSRRWRGGGGRARTRDELVANPLSAFPSHGVQGRNRGKA